MGMWEIFVAAMNLVSDQITAIITVCYRPLLSIYTFTFSFNIELFHVIASCIN